VSLADSATDVLSEFAWRGLVADCTRPGDLSTHLATAPRVSYVGFDPTADSLHVGSLLPLLALRRIQVAGHRPIVLIGGGTGLIGDPSGKMGERQLNPEEQVAAWADRLRAQVQRFLDFDRAILADNYEWLGRLQVISFLRDVGKHFPLGAMIAKESVRSRMGRSEEGISYTEFSYQVLQAYDFMALHERYDCTLQLGGSDQWGNITAGIDLIRRVKSATVYGMTLPLVSKADGTKFGKTEAGTIWLDATKTSPYEMYQFWLNTADSDVVTYLKYFTFLTLSRIAELAEVTQTAPERREAQEVLAEEATRLVHGEEGLREAREITERLFKGEVKALTREQAAQACSGMPVTSVKLDAEPMAVVDLLMTTGLAESKKRARELIAAGAIHLNGDPVATADVKIGRADALHGRYFIVRRGKKTYHAVTVA